MKKVKNGFTLVELSIVLVIIGLLIGGILVGQSLIDSAKINQAVRQIQQYDIAVSNFQEKFKQLPGDSDLMTPSGNNDGDSVDVVAGGVPVCGVATCRESYSFWKHLSDSGALKGSYSNDFSSDWQAGVNSPSFLDSTLSHYYNGATDYGYAGPSGWLYNSRDIEGVDIFAIEKKIDDGNVYTGYVRSEDDTTLDACEISGVECKITITIMSTAGQPLNN